jgi:hypothetical protein
MTLQPGIEQFNLDVTELEAHAPSLQPWRSKRTGAGGTRQDQLPPLILEVYVSSNDSTPKPERVMVERWVLRHDTDPGGAEGVPRRVPTQLCIDRRINRDEPRRRRRLWRTSERW